MTFDWTTVAVVAGFACVLAQLQSWRLELAGQLRALEPGAAQAWRKEQFEQERQRLVKLYRLQDIKKNPSIDGWESLTDEEAWQWRHFIAHSKALMREYGMFP